MLNLKEEHVEAHISGMELSPEQQFPMVAPRYFSDEDLSVFRCWGLHARCKGGPPGECCAQGRRGITCAECEPELMPAADDSGSCKACAESDKAVSVIVVALAFVLLCLVYHVIDTTNYARQEHALLLCAMTISMLIALSQQLGVISSFAITWEERRS